MFTNRVEIFIRHKERLPIMPLYEDEVKIFRIPVTNGVRSLKLEYGTRYELSLPWTDEIYSKINRWKY